METFLGFLTANREGIYVLILCLFALALLVQWLAWSFGWGRFRERQSTNLTVNPVRYMLADLFAKIVDQFRHLLALVVVLLFAIALFAAMVPGLMANNIEAVADGVQAVAAALGGLIGSIIGYYFGESAGAREGQGEPVGAGVDLAEEEQEQGRENAAGVQKVAKPKPNEEKPVSE